MAALQRLLDQYAARTRNPDVLRHLLGRGAQPYQLACDPGFDPADQRHSRHLHLLAVAASNDPQQLARYVATGTAATQDAAARNPACPNDVRLQALTRILHDDPAEHEHDDIGAIIVEAAAADPVAFIALLKGHSTPQRTRSYQQLAVAASQTGRIDALIGVLDHTAPGKVRRLLNLTIRAIRDHGGMLPEEALALLEAGYDHPVPQRELVMGLDTVGTLETLIGLRDRGLISDKALDDTAAYHADSPVATRAQFAVLLERSQPAELAWALRAAEGIASYELGPLDADDDPDAPDLHQLLAAADATVGRAGHRAELTLVVLAHAGARTGIEERTSAFEQHRDVVRTLLQDSELPHAVVAAAGAAGQHAGWMLDAYTQAHPDETAAAIRKIACYPDLAADHPLICWAVAAVRAPEIAHETIEFVWRQVSHTARPIIDAAVEVAPGAAAETGVAYPDSELLSVVVDALDRRLLDAAQLDAALSLLAGSWVGTLDELADAARQLTR